MSLDHQQLTLESCDMLSLMESVGAAKKNSR
jgi:hypothetical protein